MIQLAIIGFAAGVGWSVVNSVRGIIEALVLVASIGEAQ